jgi:hypothetical protein
VSGAGSYPSCSEEDLAMRYDWISLWRSTIGILGVAGLMEAIRA